MHGLGGKESCDRLVMSAMGEAMADHSRPDAHFPFLLYIQKDMTTGGGLQKKKSPREM